MGLGPCAIANRWERRPALGVFGRRGLDRKIVSCPDSEEELALSFSTPGFHLNE